MPRDARLGFVVGVTLVILIAVIFYHGDGKAGTAGNVGSAGAKALAKGKEALTPIAAPKSPTVRTHVVQEGETLTSIAMKHYGDAERQKELYAANRSQLRSIGDVPIGTVLVIPDLPPVK